MYPTTSILHRVFSLRVVIIVENEAEILSGGTMFVIDVDSRQYLITARHIARYISSNTQVQVWRDGRWNDIPIRIIGHGTGDIDISVLDSSLNMIPLEYRFTLPTGLGQIALGQEMMFLGFPIGYDLSTTHLLPTSYPIPLVKYARLSAMGLSGYPMWFDGHSNQGFSGAPICFVRDGDSDSEVRVAGVVTAYKPVNLPVYTPDGYETGLYHQENMGLGLAWDIQHCLDIIDQNPIGLELPRR